MKEGGVNASEGANALKSGLASLINPTDKASQMLASMGINIRDIVARNKGDLRATVLDFAKALDTLDPLRRAQAIEQLFGKFQFARLSTLFDNVIRDGNQASRVLDLASASIDDLAQMSEKELGMTAESSMNKFLKTVEDLKAALAPVGEVFLQTVTPFLDGLAKVVEGFNKLPTDFKKIVTMLVTVIGGLGPVFLMTFGLIANGIANSIKFINLLRNGFLRLTGQSTVLGETTEYMTQEQLQAAAAAASLDQAHQKLTQRFTIEASVVRQLRDAYEQALVAGNKFALLNPGMMRTGAPKKFASGGFVSGSGSGDTVAAMLTPGEFVVNKQAAQTAMPFLEALNSGKVPGFAKGGKVKGYQKGGKVTGTEFAHIGEIIKIDTESLQKVLKDIPESISTRAAKVIEAASSVFGKNLEANVYGKLGIRTGATAEGVSINNLLGKTGVSQADFLADWDKQGLARWKDSLKYANLNMQDVSGELQILDDHMKAYMTSLDSNTKILDADVKKAYEFAAKKMGPNGTLVRAFDALEKTAGEVRVNISQSMAQAAGLPMAEGGGSKGARQLGDMKVRLGGDRFTFYTKAGFNIAEAADAGLAEGIKQATQQKSPSKKAFEAGRNIGVGAIQGIESVQKRPPRRAGTSGQTAAFDERSQSYKLESKLRKQEESRQIAIGRVTNNALNSVSNFSNKLMGASFALSSVTGIMSMFGGEMAEITNIIFGVSNALFALTTVTSLLTKAKMVERGMSMFAEAGGIAGLARGKGRGARGIAKTLPTAAGPISKLGNIFSGLGRIVTTVAGGLLRFIPIIGAVATAFMAYQFFADMAQKQKEKIEGLGNTAAMSAEKIQKLGDLVGATVRATPLGEAKPTVSATGGAATAEQRSLTQQVLASETFATDFATEIEAIRTAGKEQAQLVLSSLAINLAGQGFAKEQVDAIVGAILTEAGRRDVKIDFGKLDLNVAANRDMINAQLDAQVSKLNEVFKVVNNQLTTDSVKAVSDVAGVMSALFNGMSGQLAAGTLSAEAFNEQFAQLSTRLSAIRNSAQSLAIMKNILENVNPELAKSIENVKSLRAQLIILKGASVGIAPTEEEIKAFQILNDPESSAKAQSHASKILAKYNDKIQTYIGLIEQASKQPPLTPEEEISQSNVALEDQVTKLKEQKAAYDNLVLSGIPAAEAVRLLGNEAIVAAAKHGKLDEKTLELVNSLIAATNEMDALTAGGGEKSVFEQAVESLQEQRKEIKENSIAYSKLRKAGLDIATAFRIAEDPILAAALATTKVGTKQWSDLIKKIKETDKAIQNSELKKLLTESKAELQLQREFSKIAPELAKAGFELDAIQDIMSDPVLAKKFVDEFSKAGNKAKFINDQLRGIQERKTIQVKIQLATTEGSADVANEIISNARRGLENQAALIRRDHSANIKAAEKEVEKLNEELKKVNKEIAAIEEQISDKQREIEIDIERPIQKLQEEINDLQRNIEIQFERPLAALQEESSDLAENLAIIDNAADAINEKYNAQEKALQDISKVNQQIINQQKSQISLADALSQRDISAAAGIMQDMRAQAAAASAGSISDALTAARQAELAGIRSPSGMTREQIEKRQYEIARQTYQLEEEREKVQARIQTIQDNIYNLEEQREAKLLDIRDLEDKVYNLIERQGTGQEALNAKIEIAEDRVVDLQKALDAALKPVEDQLDQWELIDLEVQAATTAGYNYVAMLNQAKAVLDQMKGMQSPDGTLPGVPVTTGGATGNGATTGDIPTAKDKTPLEKLLEDPWVKSMIATIESNRQRVQAITRDNRTDTAAEKKLVKDLMAQNIPLIQHLRSLGVPGYARGGMIGGYAQGGLIPNPMLSDRVPALLTPGEFVVNKNATKQFAPLLNSINSGKPLSNLLGNLVAGSMLSAAGNMSGPSFSAPGTYRTSMRPSGNNAPAQANNSVYNYELNVNVSGSNVDANTIANTVITKIQQIDSQRIRRQVAR